MRERAEGGAPMDAAQAEAADRGVKAMIPIGRPFLDYVLSALADAGYTEACLVIGPEHDAIREYYERTAPPRRMRVSFAIQAEPRGTADALLAAEAFASVPPGYLVMNADNYYPVEELRRLRELDEPGTVLFEPDALVRESNIPAERIRAFALGAVTSDGYLARLIEKPNDADVKAMGADALVSMNFWRLDGGVPRQLPPRAALTARRAGAAERGARRGRRRHAHPRPARHHRRARPVAARRHRVGCRASARRRCGTVGRCPCIRGPLPARARSEVHCSPGPASLSPLKEERGRVRGRVCDPRTSRTGPSEER